LAKSTTAASKNSLAVYPFLWLIKIYRVTLSPLIGNQCRFYPTCSHYAEDALKKYGAARGTWLSIKRVFRCHPWHKGGFDPVP
jgi:putative membrane protein insertion efficiency factor